MGLADRFRIRDKGERDRRLEDTVPLVAGVDPTDPDTPRFLPVTKKGVRIDAGGLVIPSHNSVTISEDGNVSVFKADGVTVATLTITENGDGSTTFAIATPA